MDDNGLIVVDIPEWSWHEEGVNMELEVQAFFDEDQKVWRLEVFAVPDQRLDQRFAVADGSGRTFKRVLDRLLDPDETYGVGELVPPV